MCTNLFTNLITGQPNGITTQYFDNPLLFRRQFLRIHCRQIGGIQSIEFDRSGTSMFTNTCGDQGLQYLSGASKVAIGHPLGQFHILSDTKVVLSRAAVIALSLYFDSEGPGFVSHLQYSIPPPYDYLGLVGLQLDALLAHLP